MIVAERKKQILKIIQKNQFISLQELKKVTKTSLSTVRRDLDILAADGLVRRVHGGVEWIESSRDSLPVSERLSLYQATKQKIAQRAAQQLQGGEIIFLDAGTTTGELIPYLADKKPAVTVVTNSVHHAAQLSDLMIPVMIIGGQVKQTTDAVIGAAAVNQINHMVFNVSFVGADGLSVEFGLTTPDLEEAAIKKAVVERSQVSYVLADNSKIGTAAFAKAVDLERVVLVTSALTNQQWQVLSQAMTVIDAEENK
ncbi:DeoR/GlpR family DNA-binding transcription regulator [Leuconostoc citreum]|uniref:DeoR/GlpR family DNA-binding transcription regulator n=1 Tax=Leuconostoc citreum TaxID=33964 RepID=UPI0002465D8C|nr:DeoR/GlpR family DNA-binding transcription regulator [Leuconostoc citreum]MCS8583074.1 DeoR/GlpR transcriptional regulator [Leuconostoc citreum]MCS8601436.1 DeoR/GlpR transcriptional regulator [Leuconostoc citreum]MCT3054393.1 DeoR/GlpR transcriptional regulator [Leuconostoc citreum]MCT3056110.1 DeoR/GlpR transcriptional regulator [Leuconostoc citreum]MCT3059876.1 DeoR/GlpR transcriptional regulator [Leuconostoc citreum]